MPAQVVPVAMPLGGLNKNASVGDQPPFTSRDLLNVLPHDKRTGRTQLSARNGLSAVFTGYLGAAGVKIHDLRSVPYNARHVTYAADSTPDETFATAMPDLTGINKVFAGLRDDFFGVESNRTLIRFNRYGAVICRVDIRPPPSFLLWNTLHTFEVVGIDEDGAVYVASITAGAGATVAGTLFKFAETLADREKYELQWVINPPHTTGLGHGFVCRVIGHQGKLYVALNQPVLGSEVWQYENTTASTGPTPAQRIRLAAYNGAEIGGGAGTPGLSTLWSIADAAWTHDMDLRVNGPLELIVCGSDDSGVAGATYFLFKLVSGGTALGGTWIGNSNYAIQNDAATALDTAPPNMLGGGIGYACRFSTDGSIYSMGPRNTNDGGVGVQGYFFRHIGDTGTAWSVVAGVNGAWASDFATYIGAAGNALQYGYPCIDVDSFGNVFVPTCRNTAGVKAAHVFKPTGALYTSIGHQTGSPAAATNNLCSAVALASTEPEYQEDDYKIAEQVFTSGSAVTTLLTTSSAVQGYRILAATARDHSPRDLRNVGVVGGAIKVFTASGSNTPTNSTARTTPLSADATYISSCELRGRLFFSDGIDYAVYDPLATVADPYGTITNLNATTLGVVPPRGRFVAQWNNRLIVARFPDRPYNWHMSAFGDEGDWDTEPSIDPLPTQSIAGRGGATGESPDLINGLFSYNDDFLVFLCDHSILVLAGDPMVGGKLGILSDKIGGAFGTPCCKDPEGWFYFFGSRGGVYRIHPSSRELQWITRDTIEYDLNQIDLGTNYVRMEWNTQDNGLMLFVMPRGTGGTLVTHYFWSGKTKGWFPLRFGTASDTTVQPTAVCVADGDLPGDRVMMLGTEDGRVLKWDSAAFLDDTSSIYSKALIGPIAPWVNSYETKFSDPNVVLTRAGGGTHIAFFVSEDDSLPGMPIEKARLRPGRCKVAMSGVGATCYLQLSSATQPNSTNGSEQWTVEEITLSVAQGGRKLSHA